MGLDRLDCLCTEVAEGRMSELQLRILDETRNDVLQTYQNEIGPSRLRISTFSMKAICCPIARVTTYYRTELSRCRGLRLSTCEIN